jgi:hypothetical protein
MSRENPTETGGDLAMNWQTSAREVVDFTSNPPARYFAYVSTDHKSITTWMGERLGSITSYHEYRVPSFGWPSVRVAIRVRAINGREYHGTYYASAGDYCRLKVCKQ